MKKNQKWLLAFAIFVLIVVSVYYYREVYVPAQEQAAQIREIRNR